MDDRDEGFVIKVGLAEVLTQLVEVYIGGVDEYVNDVLYGLITYNDLIDFIEAQPKVHSHIVKTLMEIDGDDDKVFEYIHYLAQTMLDKTTQHGENHFVGVPSSSIH